jgi:NAD(P)-dependent dehydrogenase (short-subunit alcohol dehydrogenase family)/acyl carrier protein
VGTAVTQPDGEDQIAFRNGKRYVGRIAQSTTPTLDRQPPRIRSDATYLITGGAGSLGRNIATWLIRNGATRLVLTGRRRPSAEALAVIAELERGGAHITFVPADVSRKEELSAALASIPLDFPLRGIIHTAGVLDDGVLMNLDWDRFSSVMAPKVAGSWNLHIATENAELDFFVLFSSAASLLGSPGQGNYAAANAYMDALAHYRRAHGLPAVSINWGPWAEVGMAAALAQRSSRSRTPKGVSALSVEDGLRVLSSVLQGVSAQLCVMPVNWTEFLRQFPSDTPVSVFSRVAGARQANQATETTSDPALLRQIETARPGERPGIMLAAIRNEVACALGIDNVESVDPQQGFFEMGLDSLMAVELKTRLSSMLKRNLPASLMFQYPNIEELSAHLLREIAPLEDSRTAVEATETERDEFGAATEEDLLTLLAGEVDGAAASVAGESG